MKIGTPRQRRQLFGRIEDELEEALKEPPRHCDENESVSVLMASSRTPSVGNGQLRNAEDWIPCPSFPTETGADASQKCRRIVAWCAQVVGPTNRMRVRPLSVPWCHGGGLIGEHSRKNTKERAVTPQVSGVCCNVSLVSAAPSRCPVLDWCLLSLIWLRGLRDPRSGMSPSSTSSLAPPTVTVVEASEVFLYHVSHGHSP